MGSSRGFRTDGGVVALLCSAALGVGFIVGALSQQGWVSRPGIVLSKSSCHDNGDGTFCDVEVSYQAANGETKVTTLTGVGHTNHNAAGQETVSVYFKNAHSDTPISPGKVFPLWAGILGAVVALGIGAFAAISIWRGAVPEVFRRWR